MRIKNKKAFDLPFSVIFAIIAGSIIIFIAIYATVSLIKNSQTISYSKSAQELSNYLNPVVNGIASAYATKIDFRKETRLYLNCSGKSYTSFFGSQTIAFSEESGLLKKWTNPGAEITRDNKYVFSNSMEQGKILYIFSKPFFTGYRVDDLVMIGFNKYCFVSAPEDFQTEMQNMNLGNYNFSSGIELCARDSVKVCFDSSAIGCNITVYGDCTDINCNNIYDFGRITKNGKTVEYFGNLLYAGIFSSPEIYECNIKRLGIKSAELAKIYKQKVEIVKLSECNSLISPYLEQIFSIANTIKSSSQLKELYGASKLMDEQTCEEDCKIYEPEKC